VASLLLRCEIPDLISLWAAIKHAIGMRYLVVREDINKFRFCENLLSEARVLVIGLQGLFKQL
jgi:hypothetical protein